MRSNPISSGHMQQLRLLLVLSAVLTGCVGQIGGDDNDACKNPQQFFDTQIYEPLMSQTCANCHTENGQASATRFKLRTGDTAADKAANLELVRQVASIEYQGESLLIAKPTGMLTHEGGIIIAEGSTSYRALKKLVRICNDPTLCSETQSCDDFSMLSARVWRLTPSEYEATLQAALGEAIAVASMLAADEQVYGFTNNASVLAVTELRAEQLIDIGEIVGERVVARSGELAPCSGGSDERACAREFTLRFGEALFRRPMLEEEVDDALALFDVGRDGGTYTDGISLVAQGLAQAPQTIYRSELGSADEGVQTLTSREIASAMSYMLTGQPPDAQLILLTGDDVTLAKADVRRREAERLLDTAAGHARLVQFALEWLGLIDFSHLERDLTRFPEYTPTLRDAMLAEVKAYVEDIVASGGTFEQLMTAAYTYMNDDLAAVYAMPPVGGSALVKTNVSGPIRGGVLTLPAMMARYAHSNQSSPVQRGRFVREKLLCQQLPPPPAINFTFPQPTETTTTRGRFEEHSKNPQCAICHTLIDPIGFGLERYDPIGRARDNENGFPIDSSGRLDDAGLSTTEFDGGAELDALIAQSGDARNCFVKQVMRYSKGRVETINDVCAVNEATATFEASGTSVREVVLSLVSSDNFVRRRH